MKLTQKRVRVLMKRAKESRSDNSGASIKTPIDAAVQLLTHDTSSPLDGGTVLGGNAALLSPLLDNLVAGQVESTSHSGQRVEMLDGSFDGFVLGSHGPFDIECTEPMLTQAPLALQARLAFPQACLAGSIETMTIHARIKMLREAAKLSQTKLGEKVGVKYQAVQQWEKKSVPEIDKLDALAEALKTTKEHLLFGTPIVSKSANNDPTNSGDGAERGSSVPDLHRHVAYSGFRRVYAVKMLDGGLPERLWTDGDLLVGATVEYANLAIEDPQAFLIPIIGVEMIPKFNPGDFAIVEPHMQIDIEDDVAIRLTSGETMIKRLVSRRGGVQVSAYNDPVTRFLKLEEISWMYYVSGYVPAKKMKTAG